jgi:response regulator of citrate/malate metabolism
VRVPRNASAGVQAAPAGRGRAAGGEQQLVERVLRVHDGDLSAAECAELTELSRVSARRYLEHFVATGSATVRLRYGGIGRPERRYRWSG